MVGDPRDATKPGNGWVELDLATPVWERFYTVAPLVLVGTRDAQGTIDLAPKHMAFPMGWDNWFGFVCTPSHATYANIEATGGFTVSYPRPAQLVASSLAATPRGAADKPVLQALPTEPARYVDGIVLADAYVQLECEHHQTVDGFGRNSLITGRIVAARVHPDALRQSEQDDGELLAAAPLLAYLYPGRFSEVGDTRAFPFPAGMKK